MLFILFGASGDLSRRKILPAFYHAFLGSKNADAPVLLGVGRSEFSDADYQEVVSTSLVDSGIEPVVAARWCRHSVAYQQVADYSDLTTVCKRASEMESRHGLDRSEERRVGTEWRG